MADGAKGARKPRNALLGAAVIKALLERRSGVEPAPRLAGGSQLPGPTDGIRALYQGVLRDLGLTDAEVVKYLAAHRAEVEEAIKGHGRRGV